MSNDSSSSPLFALINLIIDWDKNINLDAILPVPRQQNDADSHVGPFKSQTFRDFTGCAKSIFQIQSAARRHSVTGWTNRDVQVVCSFLSAVSQQGSAYTKRWAFMTTSRNNVHGPAYELLSVFAQGIFNSKAMAQKVKQVTTPSRTLDYLIHVHDEVLSYTYQQSSEVLIIITSVLPTWSCFD
jgi:hypothetical protein